MSCKIITCPATASEEWSHAISDLKRAVCMKLSIIVRNGGDTEVELKKQKTASKGKGDEAKSLCFLLRRTFPGNTPHSPIYDPYSSMHCRGKISVKAIQNLRKLIWQ